MDHKGRQLDCSLWGLTKSRDGNRLFVGEYDCSELAKEYGTPLTVVNQKKLTENYLAFSEALKKFYPQSGIFYSYKTNPLPGVLQILHSLGAGAEVVSEYELWLAMHLGVSPEKIVYNGPIKSRESLRISMEKGIKLLNINSFDEIPVISELSEHISHKQKVGVRVTLGQGWRAQFGINILNGDAFKAFRELAECKNLDVCGLHFHLGTKLNNFQIYQDSVSEAMRFVKKLKKELHINIRIFDAGGGYGVPTVRDFGRFETKLMKIADIPYKAPDIESHPTVTMFCKAISNALLSGCKENGLDTPELIMEPGRSVTSNAQMLLIEVVYTKMTDDGIEIAVTNGGSNTSPWIVWEYHELFVVNKMKEEANGRIHKYRIAGSSCNPKDLISECKILPYIQKGDVMAIMDTGAYHIPNMTTFSYPRPGAVLISGREKKLIRKHECFEELVSLDVHNQSRRFDNQ